MKIATRVIVLLVVSGMFAGCFTINARAPERVNVSGFQGNGGGPPPPPPRNGEAGYASIVGYDTLAHPGQAVQLALWQPGLAGTEVGFHHNQTVIARARFDAEGYARAWWTPPAEGVYTITARPLNGTTGGGLLVVSAQRPTAPLVVVDFDNAIVASRAKRAWLGQSKAQTGAASALAAIAREHPIVYLTRDNEELGQATKNWLNQAGFPVGPILLSAPNSDPFKSSLPGSLTANFRSMRAAVVGKPADAEAFASRRVPAYLLVKIDDDDYKELRKRAREIRPLPSEVSPATSWNQVADGITRNLRYSAADVAAQLERQADIIERRKKKDD